jgi:hypothetical protein
MQAQVEALQAELTSTRAAYQRVHAKWTEDKQFLAGLIVVATAAQEALATATPAQRVEFLTQYARGSKLFKAEGHIACEPAQSPRFRQDMPATVSFVEPPAQRRQGSCPVGQLHPVPLKGPAMRHQKHLHASG